MGYNATRVAVLLHLYDMAPEAEQALPDLRSLCAVDGSPFTLFGDVHRGREQTPVHDWSDFVLLGGDVVPVSCVL